MDAWTIVLSAIAGLIGIYYFLVREPDCLKKAGVPHLPGLPIVGNIAYIFTHRMAMTDFLRVVYNLEPTAKYAGMFDFAAPTVILRDLELIKQIGVKNFDNFTDHRNFVDEKLEPFFGRNLFFLRGEVWRGMRNLLSPAFTSSKMRAMFKLMNDCAVKFADHWSTVPAESRACVDVKDAFTRYTNDVIATCAFGIEVDSLKDRENDFYVLGKEATNFTPIRSIKFFITRNLPLFCKITGMRLISDRVTRFFMNVVETTIRTRDERGISRPDMIQLMMESRGKRGENELTIEDMTSQAFVFFFGGFESTSTLMCFAAHLVAVNPSVRDKLLEEIVAVDEETQGELTYEALNRMKYLDAVVNEALRLYPVVIATDRVCTSDFVLPPCLPGAKPMHVKRGMYLWIPVYALQRDSKYFERPDDFVPERFLDENRKENNMAAYMPFGVGPRMCIGNRFALMETKVLLYHLLLRNELRRCEKTPDPIVITRKSINLAPEGGFWLTIEPKSKDSRPRMNGELKSS